LTLSPTLYTPTHLRNRHRPRQQDRHQEGKTDIIQLVNWRMGWNGHSLRGLAN
jgi:hypothetical protein